MAKLRRGPKSDLPTEIQLFHILPRLPAKSLLRFMSVSKQWHFFIKSSVFVKEHLRHVTDGGDSHNHLKFLLLSLQHKRFKFSTIDCEAPQDGLSARRLLPFKGIRQDMWIIASFHGLLCVGMYKDIVGTKFLDIVLWNPLTGDYKTLSKDGLWCRECYIPYGGAFGLYYSSDDDDYRLLRITRNYDAHIYSLKSDSWRKLETTCMEGVDRNIPWVKMTGGTPKIVVLNDKLYMLRDAMGLPSIVRFDIKTEKFTEIQGPSYIMTMTNRWFVDMSFFVVSKGCAHLFVVRDDFKTELWRMDGDDEHWAIVGPSCQLSDHSWPLHPLVRNGNWVVTSTEASLYELDPKTLVRKFLCSYSSRGRWCAMYIPSRTKFIATLVSPNQYIN